MRPRNVIILEVMTVFWGICGVVAFVTYLIRCGRRLQGDWLELPFQFVAAVLLGMIALVGVLTNEDARF